MWVQKHSKKILTLIWCSILCVYWVAILCINFSQNPRHYCADMYSDMNYAAEVWQQKSITPEGWVFGNQRYVVATPVLAAIFWGLTGNHCIAMGIASSLMGLGTLLTFNWMLKPVFKELHERLAAMAAFMSVILLCGDAVFNYNGWQLLFTMCSYYSCYAITMFLGFGCYLRRNAAWSPKTYLMLVITCLLSIGTGMQSLRQTVIMVCPLLAAEFIKIVDCVVHKKRIFDRSLLITGVISISNLAGVLFSKLFPADQVQIFGSVNRISVFDMVSQIIPSIKNMFTLFRDMDTVAVVFFCLLFGCVVVYMVRKRVFMKDPVILCTFLFVVGSAAILAIDIATTMRIRNIYYFPLYALAAIWFAWLYTHFGKAAQISVVGLLCICFVINCADKLPRYLRLPRENYPLETVSTYLEENGITTIYSDWDCCEDIAIASDFNIKAGFWSATGEPYFKIDYLCNPNVFDVDASECAYIFQGSEDAAIGVEAARERNVELVLMKYFSKFDIYVYTADVKVMN